MAKKSAGWEEGAKWYDQLVGDAGHYYHQEVIIPFLKTWFQKPAQKIVDLGCGQAFFASQIPENWIYTGYDASKSLVQAAKGRGIANCFVEDLTTPMKKRDDLHDIALFLLSLQDMKDPLAALKNAHTLLEPGKELWVVLNHPCYRIPRQSGWGIDESKKTQYRKIESYMSENLIPIEIHPSKQETKKVFHHHFSLSLLSRWLQEAGFSILLIEELVSNKTSTGPKSGMENRARKEFPLFLCLKCRKI
ncbi:MAG: methyltransferase domain-containing protein [Chlamydiae bacterium]|nr:methyltransferase domain-containing protein [Chlamydiota bacterium]